MGRDQIEVGVNVDAVDQAADYAEVIAFVIRQAKCKPSVAEAIVAEVAAWLNASEVAAWLNASELQRREA